MHDAIRQQLDPDVIDVEAASAEQLTWEHMKVLMGDEPKVVIYQGQMPKIVVQ